MCTLGENIALSCFVPFWISCKLGIQFTQSNIRPLIIQCFHVLIVLIAHQVGRCISMLFLVSFFAQFFSLGQFTPCQACLLGSFWRRRKVQPWKKHTRAPCKIACTGKVHHENEHPQEKCVHHENLAFLRHRRQFSPLPSLFLDARRFTLSLTYILDQDSIHKLNTNFGL